jgi:TetR/AcrR family fatty acid metabolism transcriptional regulator
MAEADAKRKIRQRRGADHARDVILDAAASVFAQKGYYGTTMDDVAAASGYSPAAIYKYFRNKDDLFSRLWTAMADKLQVIFDESVRLPMPFAMRLRWLVVRASQLLETSPNLLVAFIAQRPYAARARSALEKQALRHYRMHQARIVELMQKGIEEGVLREGGAQEYSLLLIGLLYEFAHRWVMEDGRMDVGEAVDRIVDLFLRGAGRAGRC